MKIIFFLLFMLFLLFPFADSFGFPQKGQECSKCHSLSKDEATGLMRKLDPNLKVFNIYLSPIRNLWEVYIKSNKRKSLVYIDFSKKHLFFGSIIDIQEKKNLTQEKLSEIHKVNVSQIPLGDAIVMGNKKAKYGIIVFNDPD